MSVVMNPISAGGLIVRNASVAETVLVMQNGRWRIPKGMQDPGEHIVATAMREVLEETGVVAAVFAPLRSAQWSYEYEGVRCNETCHFFLMSHLGMADQAFDADEVDDVGWFDLGAAHEILTFPQEVEVAKIAASAVREGAPWDPWVLATGNPGALPGRARGPLATTRAEAERLIDQGDAPVVLLPEFSPGDVHLLSAAAAVVSVIGGPASHIAVVASALGIPSVMRLDGVEHVGSMCIAGDRGVPTGCIVEVNASAGEITVVPGGEVVGSAPRNASLSEQQSAFDWAREKADALAIPEPLNWKLFKRDVVGHFCPRPPTRRFHSPWDPEDVADYARSLSGGAVRCSAFPRTIACHSVSVVLDEEIRARWAEVIATLDSGADLEIFVEQARDQLCWRLVVAGARRVMEAGRGQAMYVFEEERGAHPTVTGRWTAGEADISFDGLDSGLALEARRFLLHCGSDLESICERVGAELNIDTFALEGYHRDGTFTFVVCDMDLPVDNAFMR